MSFRELLVCENKSTQILDMIFEVMDNLVRYITVINQISHGWRISYQNLPDFSSMLLNFAEL